MRNSLTCHERASQRRHDIGGEHNRETSARSHQDKEERLHQSRDEDDDISRFRSRVEDEFGLGILMTFV